MESRCGSCSEAAGSCLSGRCTGVASVGEDTASSIFAPHVSRCPRSGTLLAPNHSWQGERQIFWDACPQERPVCGGLYNAHRVSTCPILTALSAFCFELVPWYGTSCDVLGALFRLNVNHMTLRTIVRGEAGSSPPVRFVVSTGDGSVVSRLPLCPRSIKVTTQVRKRAGRAWIGRCHVARQMMFSTSHCHMCPNILRCSPLWENAYPALEADSRCVKET